MKNILIKTIKENLKENENNKVLVLDNLIKNHSLYYRINKDQYYLVFNRLDLYFNDMDYLNIFISNDLQFICIDFIKNKDLFLTIELNFKDKKFIKNFIENVFDKSLILNFDKIKTFEYNNKNLIELF